MTTVQQLGAILTVVSWVATVVMILGGIIVCRTGRIASIRRWAILFFLPYTLLVGGTILFAGFTSWGDELHWAWRRLVIPGLTFGMLTVTGLLIWGRMKLMPPRHR